MSAGHCDSTPDPDALEEQLRMVIIGMDPPDHRAFRAIVSKAFTPRQMTRLEQALREETVRVISELRDGSGSASSQTSLTFRCGRSAS